MALRTCRLVQTHLRQKSVKSSLLFSKRHQNTDENGGGEEGQDDKGSTTAPYNPLGYGLPNAAEYWNAKYPPISEADDDFESDYVYLDQIEERMKKYDSKYSSPDDVKKLGNEYAWYDLDDRANGVYTATQSNSHGRGKKIDPQNYFRPIWQIVPRVVTAPIQWLTPEQIRGSRGMLSQYRALLPEAPSIFKYWNSYVCFGSFTMIYLANEWLMPMSHDFVETAYGACWFGVLWAYGLDYWIQWHSKGIQEQYDVHWFQLNERVQKANQALDDLQSAPDMAKISYQFQLYTKQLSEAVLQKTLTNRINRLFNTTVEQLDKKVGQERGQLNQIKQQWRKTAFDYTIQYFDDPKVKQQFLTDATQLFASGQNAQLGSQKAGADAAASGSSDLFRKQFDANLKKVENEYLKTQKAAGTLPWVFVPSNERKTTQKSKQQKEEEFQKRVKQWSTGRNPVNIQPAFA